MEKYVSFALMNVWGKIGRDKTDKLFLLESTYSYASGMRLCDAAKLFLQTDSILFTNSNKTLIYQTLDLMVCFTVLKMKTAYLKFKEIPKFNLVMNWNL